MVGAAALADSPAPGPMDLVVLEQVTTKRPNETVIYRRGNGNTTNLTPRPIDLHTGLSYELKVPAATGLYYYNYGGNKCNMSINGSYR